MSRFNLIRSRTSDRGMNVPTYKSDWASHFSDRPSVVPEASTDSAVVVPFCVTGRTLARNTLLNLIGRFIPMAVAVLTMPYVVHQLGPDRFGILSLGWLVLGYMSIFNLGIGPAVTKFISELLGKGSVGRIPELVWTAIATQACLGMGFGLLLAGITPYLATQILRVPLNLQGETQSVILILAASLPISFVSSTFQGLLAAHQRFDLWNAVYVPSSALNFLLPVAALTLGATLPMIVLLLVLGRVGSLCALLLISLRIYPSLRRRLSFSWSQLRPLLSFGGWFTLSGAVAPILNDFDQFLIATFIGISGVGYYAPLSMISSKLVLLQSVLAAALIPAFSASTGRGDSLWVRNVFVRSLRLQVLLVGPAVIFLAFLASSILTVWLGPTFGANGSVALRILAVGVLMNSLAFIPGSLLYGVGRPDLPAKFHLAELPIHVALAWFLVSRLGLPGAALAWTARVTLDSLLLIMGACWVSQVPAWKLIGRPLMRPFAALASLAASLSIFWAVDLGLEARVSVSFLLFIVGFVPAAWHFVLDTEDRLRTRLWLGLVQ